MSKKKGISSHLNELLNLYNKKNYKRVIDKGTPYLFHREYMTKINILIALSYLHLKGFKDAKEFIDKANVRDAFDSLSLLSKAYYDLYDQKKIRAIYIYTRLLNLNKEPKRVKKILHILNKEDSLDHIIFRTHPSLFIPSKLPKNYWEDDIPMEKMSFSLTFMNQLNLKKTAFLLFILITILLSTFFIFNQIEKEKKNVFEDSLEYSQLKEIYLYKTDINQEGIYSPQELLEQFKKVKENIIERKINEAIITYNEVMLSDINDILKERFTILSKLIPSPDFSNFKNTHSLEDAIQDHKYLNTYIRLSGLITYKKNALEESPIILHLTEIENEQFIRTIKIQFLPTQIHELKQKNSYEILIQYLGFDEVTKNIILKGIALQEN